jgi:radical SAM family uncharacterized protein/radical SAM-linked protein
LISGLSDRHINDLLRNVNRPGRYCGGEINLAPRKAGRLGFLLCFPDTYEIGMSNLGLRILYHVLNKHPYCWADIAFAPWVDMEAFMKKARIPLYGLASGLPARGFDVLAFSLQYELQYTNVLNMLDLGAVPLRAADRGEGDPLVIAGGPCAFNPEPTSDFIDAYAVGDGEDVCVEIAESIAESRAHGLSRIRVLERLSEIDGIHVPLVTRAGSEGACVSRRFAAGLRDEDFPLPPIVPIIPITHDRLTLEIMRGCTRGCRFCSGGMTGRPVRERSVDSVVDLAERGIEETGWDEVSLVSLSTSDYSGLTCLVTRLAETFAGRHVSISLPSMRPGTFNEDLARSIALTKRTGLTFAPEAASGHLRRAINKNVEEDDLYTTVEAAYRNGWDAVKLYFMIGLPNESDSDALDMVRMVRSVESICRGYGKRKHVTVSLSPFVPRPHTPFQWEAQQEPDALLRRIALIRKGLPGRRVNLKWRDPFMALLEALLARGDRSYGQAILSAWSMGSRFDGWSDRFQFDLWKRVMEAGGLDIRTAYRAREVGEPLPWDYVGCGVSKGFLVDEARKAAQGITTPDCRTGVCSRCGACDGKSPVGEAAVSGAAAADKMVVPEPPSAVIRLRVRCAKTGPMRLASHLDLTRCIQRGLRRSGLPVCYSRGFSPHPRVSFGPPLSLGIAGESEYFDVLLSRTPPGDWIEDLNGCMPEGLRVDDGRLVGLHCTSLMSGLNAARYAVEVWTDEDPASAEAADAIAEALSGAGRLISLERRTCGGRLAIDAFVRLKGPGPQPDKVITRVLDGRGDCYRIVRKDLFAEYQGELHSPMSQLFVRGK